MKKASPQTGQQWETSFRFCVYGNAAHSLLGRLFERFTIFCMLEKKKDLKKQKNLKILLEQKMKECYI